MASKSGSGKKIKLTLVKSAIGYPERTKATVRALGLRRINYSVTHSDTPVIRGMIDKLRHLVKIEEA
jgi:large subunit ribosomal protein L30